MVAMHGAWLSCCGATSDWGGLDAWPGRIASLLKGVAEEKCGVVRSRHCMDVIVFSSLRYRRRKVLVWVCL